jgi:transposase
MSEKRDSEEAESARLESLYRKATDPVLRTHLLMVWRMSLGDSIREVARRVGYSQKWVREIARRYESEGVEGLGDRRHGNPGAIREGIARRGGPSTVAPSSSRGGSTRRRDVERTESGTLDRAEDSIEKVHDQRGWEYLRKVGHSPQVPRPSNAQGADSEEREAFKKSLR